jgi:hypothetical protein
MRKVLLVISAVGIVLGGIAQNKYATTNIHQLPAKKRTTIMDIAQSGPILPFNKPSMAHNKSANGILIGTSANAYTFISEDQQWMDASVGIHALMKTHRGGGAWGGSSADIKCKLSYDFGATWNDSVVFVNDGTHLRRYPSGVIYNPDGNTDPANAFAFICGPVTNSSGWVNNYFESKQFNGSNYVPHVLPIEGNADLERIDLCGGRGNYHVMSLTTNAASTGYDSTWVRNMAFNSGTNSFDESVRSLITRTYKGRVFSNGTAPWNANWNITFDDNGLHGYAYCMGADSLFDPYVQTSTPLVWETWDAGATWLTRPASGCWHTLSNLTDKIWPTRASVTGGGTLVYRPFFQGGAQGDESLTPGVIDYQGNLHIFCTVEGMYSTHPDSLGYSFANQPKLMFDAYTTGVDAYGANTWDVQFIDTIRTLPIIGVKDSTQFNNGSDTYIGWEHMMHISASPDRKVIIATWTDTDPGLDNHNTIPELKARAWNVETKMATPVINFTPGEGGMYYFINVPKQIIIDNNGDYVIPISYEDIFETGNPDVAQNHYFAEGLRISTSQFTEQLVASTISPSCITGVDHNNIVNNAFAVSQNTPNPAKSTTEITVTLKENANVNITVTNLMGQRVMGINNAGTTGKNVISINTSNLSSGIYFYTVTANNNSVTKKMMIE